MKKGFTLIETVVALMLFSIVATALISTQTDINKNRIVLNSNIEIENRLQNTMEYVSAEIKNGNSFKTSSDIEVETESLSENLIKITVRSGDKYELKKIVQKRIHFN